MIELINKYKQFILGFMSGIIAVFLYILFGI